MTLSRPVKLALGLLVAAGLSLNFLLARQAHDRQIERRQTQTSTEAKYSLPSTGALRTAFLGFETTAADLIWIWSLINYGKHGSKQQKARYVKDAARRIADLDPHFLPVYEWFATSYINANFPPSHKVLDEATAFIDRGLQTFPTSYRLAYTAGMNYIGYSRDRPPEVRLEEVETAIDYLQRASKLPGSPERLAFTIAWLYQRKRQLLAEIEGTTGGAGTNAKKAKAALSQKELEFLTDMYFLVESEKTRDRIARMLKEHDVGEQSVVERGRKYTRTLQRKHLAERAYLPVDLWTTLIEAP